MTVTYTMQEPCHTTSQSVKSRAQQHHETHNSSIQVLLSMAVGMKDTNDQEIANFETDEPFASAPQRRQWKPTNKMHLTPEMHRRWGISKNNGGRKPGSQWCASDVMNWLRAHPIDDGADVTYIQEKVTELKSFLLSNTWTWRQEAAARQAANDMHWSGPVPYLRLIHCLFDDEYIRNAYERSLGASPQSKPVVYELLANKWNDENYNPVSQICPSLHDDFSKEINLGYAAVSHADKVGPQNVRNILNAMRIRLGFLVRRWENSTMEENGGGIVIDQKEGGVVASLNIFCDEHGQDVRSSFLQGDAPYLLYLWHYTRTFNLTSKMIEFKNNSNNNKIQQVNTKVPSVIRLEKSSACCSDGSTLTDHHNMAAAPELGTISKSIVNSLKRETENIIYTTKLARMNALDRMILEIMSRIECLEDKIEKADSTSDRNNRSLARWKQCLQQYQNMLKEKDEELEKLRNQE
eukprot:CAMPEP_0176487992 /NCGR_PEP_ID=MMETSP0200_2-20121128/6453_1 /TAXON_ID=947934 /ORGANISM="Chaetoceros sp., Strain GSL56" /LENGTH=464 /DNA_ID=CAMNT_0017884909 /DNA_START=413 /DNA_END=1807 /DNA_ORIENTATION=-